MARKRGGWKIKHSSRVNLGAGVFANIGGGVIPRWTSTSVKLGDGVTWNSKGTLSIVLGKGWKAVRNLGRRRG